MKNNNFISFVTALVIGLVIGGGVIGLIWHNSLKTASRVSTFDQGINKPNSASFKEITLKEKMMYSMAYKQASKRHFWSLSRISLYRPQYDAMTYLLQKNGRLAGFRLNAGIVGDPKDVVIVNGIDATGKDDTTTPPILTPVEPCPPCCDDTTAAH